MEHVGVSSGGHVQMHCLVNNGLVTKRLAKRVPARCNLSCCVCFCYIRSLPEGLVLVWICLHLEHSNDEFMRQGRQEADELMQLQKAKLHDV